MYKIVTNKNTFVECQSRTASDMDLSRGGFLSLVPQLVRDPCWTICHPYFYQDILRTINKSVIAAWTGWNLNVRSMSRSPLRSTSVGQWNVSVLYLLLYLRRCGTELRLHKRPDITGRKKKKLRGYRLI